MIRRGPTRAGPTGPGSGAGTGRRVAGIAEQRGPVRLLDQMRDVLRRLHYSLRTEESYVQWVRRFILFHDKRHPASMGEAEVTAYLNHLAVNRTVAASTQNQALSAILTVRRYWGFAQSESLVDAHEDLTRRANDWAMDRVVPLVVNPLAQAIASRS